MELSFREITENLERQTLSPYACFSNETRGREEYLKPCNIRTEYQRDRDRIIHCKAYRRLMHKTQVFLSPEGDHYRTRLTHTNEVTQVARTMARALRLNEDLTEAIALGHDLGHTPFGHAGEEALNSIYPLGFKHSVQSVRVVEKIEKLNLTWEVRNGILCHSSGKDAETREGQIVRFADKIAYINHDIEDA
ncbi:MAG: HD domain-containing protein, partial [Oscillospiraceae bacterium]